MARYEFTEGGGAALGTAPLNAEAFFDLGMMYSAGRGVPVDLVSAHMWFNLAALRGSSDAVRLRREVAEQMSEADVSSAQRAARDWLKTH